MSLINKKILYSIGTISFLAVAGCNTTPEKPEKPLQEPQQEPQQDCKVDVEKLYSHYKGECKNGKADGAGKAVGKDMYEGQFANGKPHGQGTYTWDDKASFKGQFKNGVAQIPHQGCYVADVRLRGTYKGECRNNKAYGRGKAVGIDTYEGGFINGVLNGPGTYIWHNGDRYIGQFKDGNAHGRGVMKHADGKQEIGPW